MEKTDLKKIATPREMVLFSVLFLSLIAIFSRLLYSPLQEQIHDLKKQYGEVKSQKMELETQLNALIKLQNQKQQEVVTIESPNAKIQMLKGKIRPSFDDLPSILARFASGPILAGATITGFSSNQPMARDGYIQTSITISAKGSFQDITRFIENMEHTRALVALASISIAKVPDVEGEMDSQIIANLYQVEGIHAH